MKFNYTQKREQASFAQRSVAMGPRSMVASSQQLATLAGHRALARGGNAVDAAVAMVSTLNVVEPHSVGIGGDAFALIYLAKEDKLVGMNGSGRAPGSADLAWFHDKGIKAMPERGILPITVPGALHAWAQAVERYGKLPLADLFEDAIFYAENGFPVSEVIAGEWKSTEPVLQAHEDASQAYLIDGKAPRPGQVFRNRALAQTYRKIAEKGVDTFYRGELARTIEAFFRRHGGLLTAEDLAAHTTTWVEPISKAYRGYTVYELPPNGQGVTALEMLNILEGYDIAALGPNDPEYLHLLLEAKKIAFSDRDFLVTDPEFEDVPVAGLLSGPYAEQCRRMIDPSRAMRPPRRATYPPSSETVYVTAVDEERNAVSFISSIYMAFGSGMVVGGTGIALQNRGHSFSLDSRHPNHIVPGKRPMHTIIPGMVFKDGRFLMSFGVMGGDMQPQGHVQFLVNLIDFGMNLQEALDTPRARHMDGDRIHLEAGIPDATAAALEAKGHRVLRAPSAVNEVGGGQAIYRDPEQDVLLGGSDRRKDGCAISR